MVVTMMTTGLINIRQITYEASSTVMLSPVALGVFNTPTALNEVIVSDTLLTEVINKGKFKYSVLELKKMVHAENATGSNIIAITVSAPDKTSVHKIANLAAQRFIAYAKTVDPEAEKTAAQLRITRATLKWLDEILYKQNSGKSKIKQPLLDTTHIDGEIRAAKKELAQAENKDIPASEKAIIVFALNQRLAALEEQRPRLIDQKLLLVDREQSLLAQEQTLMNNLEEGPRTKILTAAVRPTTPASPNITANLIFAALAALIAGCGLAIAYETVGQGAAL